MAPSLAQILKTTQLEKGEVALFWLGQAGFAIKTSDEQLIFIDAYLSRFCENREGHEVTSKRLIEAPLEAHEITRGLMVATHCHEDHLDIEAIRSIAERSPLVHFAGPISCVRAMGRDCPSAERIHLLELEKTNRFDGFDLLAVYADHGEAEPDAVGVVIEIDGMRIYHTGDTCYCPDRMRRVIEMRPDIIIPCINGVYGNMNSVEAARLAHEVGANAAIPCHFWLFIGQNTHPQGTPMAFWEACQQYAPTTRPVFLRVAEPFVYRRGMTP